MLRSAYFRSIGMVGLVILLTSGMIQAKQQSPKATASGNQRNSTAQQNEPRHVVIDSRPVKDIWDKLYIVLTVALVIIGGGTLSVIWYQAVQNRKAAEAALLNATAFISSQ